MKTNEAPEKIYIQSFNVSEEEAKFDKSKLFFDDVWTEEPEPGEENIEYTRTDVFIDKAVKFIKDNIELDKYNSPDEESYKMGCGVNYFETNMFIEDFKNYMKGE